MASGIASSLLGELSKKLPDAIGRTDALLPGGKGHAASMVGRERRTAAAPAALLLRFAVAVTLGASATTLPRSAPPLGAVYKRTMSLPVIGEQTIELTIISDSAARIIMSGRLNLDEPVRYDITPEGQLHFELTDTTHRILRRFRTTLDAAGYDAATDTSWVVVWPPLPMSVRIQLKRNEEARDVSSHKTWHAHLLGDSRDKLIGAKS